MVRRPKLIWRNFLLLLLITLPLSSLCVWLANSFEYGQRHNLLIVVIVDLVASVVLAAILEQPLKIIENGLHLLAEGKFGHRLPPLDTQEFAKLTEAVNRVAETIEQRVEVLVNDRAELEAVLSSMIEGVIAVDAHERVLSHNQAAVRLFGLDRKEAIGKSIQEVIRSTELHRLMALTLYSDTPVEGDITFYDQNERCLHVHGTVLRNPAGDRIGGLIVVHDVTRLRKLELARSDFVANVSHELRTPITSIKGYAETLMDGDVDTEDTKRFLAIMVRQSNMLSALIDDLMALSRLEQETRQGAIERTEERIRDVLDAAVLSFRDDAEARNIQVLVECDAALTARLNQALLERAVANLVDNAVKYSNDNSQVVVRGETARGEVILTVEDTGCGIGKDHIPRLFERFYRVDRARSRKMGGTGLGLAIVKHIALAHGGYAAVESAPGKGSTFTIHLPAA